jgi:hypothetical protein
MKLIRTLATGNPRERQHVFACTRCGVSYTTEESRAILHNSNYGSVQECKTAIDSYFAERNRTFLEHPKRAGKKIWGQERVASVFGLRS